MLLFGHAAKSQKMQKLQTGERVNVLSFRIEFLAIETRNGNHIDGALREWNESVHNMRCYEAGLELQCQTQ